MTDINKKAFGLIYEFAKDPDGLEHLLSLRRQGRVLIKEEVENLDKLTPETKREDISKLFYELHEGTKNPIKSGLFKEVKDIDELYIMDKRLPDPEYLSYHNFVYLKSEQP